MNTNEDDVVMKALDKLIYGDFDEILHKLKQAYDDVCAERDRYLEKLGSWNRDDEIKRLNEEIILCRKNSLQNLTDIEKCKYNAFYNKHYDACGNSSRRIIELCGTGIGTAITVSCPICGEQEDISDYEHW